MTSYTYSIQNDTANHKIDSDSLSLKISRSIITKALDHIDTVGDSAILYFKDELTLVEQAILTQIVNQHDGVSLIPPDHTSDGLQKIAPSLQVVSPLWMVSHNFADKLTWWQESARVVDEVLVQLTPTTWQVANPYILDLEHGRLTNEDDIASGPLSLTPLDLSTHVGWNDWNGGQNLRPTLTANDEILNRVDGTPNEAPLYSIDYVTGIITTGSDRTGQTLKFSYHYAQGGGYKFPPIPDKLYKISITQAKFSNVDMNSVVMAFSIFSGETEVARRIYRGIKDYLSASLDAPVNWRDPVSGQTYTTMIWDYKRPASPASDSRISIKSSHDMYIYLRPQHDGDLISPDPNNLTNPYLVVTLFSTSESDP